MTKRWARQQTGFTIVELLIVIIVIAILATISIVAYNGIQARARDTIRKTDVAAISKALKLYSVDNGPMFTNSGCGSGGNGSGWFNYNYGSPGGNMNTCLKNSGVTNKAFNDPSGVTSCGVNTDCHVYMKYTCAQSGQTVTYVYANLETGTHDGTETDGTCAANNDTTYGMNYYDKFSE